ncbi:MAG: response regulator [Sandaracinus sp.]|nr:response regulator [Sandaracinus sp.]
MSDASETDVAAASAPIHLLVIEDEEAHVELLRRAYEDARRAVELEVVPTLEDARRAMERRTPDAVVADFVLPDGRGLDLLPVAAARGCPVVLMTSQGDENVAVEALRGGAFDYVVKTPRALAAMPRTVDRALREHALLLAHRRAVEASQRSEERLRATLVSLGEVVFGLDEHAVIRDLHVPDELRGVFPEVAVGEPLEALLPASVARTLEESLAASGAGIVEHSFAHAAHEFRARVCPRLDGGWTVALRDETARRAAERARERLETELRHVQRLETLGTLAGGVAHDFNNLLVPVMMGVDLGCEAVPEGSRARAALDNARTAAERARGLVQRLLSFSRSAEAHERRRVTLAQVVREALPVLRVSLGGRELKLDLEDGPEVVIDVGQIEQVVLNLVMNAHQALGERSGPIELRVRVTEAEDTKWAELAVRDRGEGIAPEVLERIFDPFFTTKGPGHGTGLGLTVVNGIVQAHGGTVHARSAPGEGTELAVRLPPAE